MFRTIIYVFLISQTQGQLTLIKFKPPALTDPSQIPPPTQPPTPSAAAIPPPVAISSPIPQAVAQPSLSATKQSECATSYQVKSGDTCFTIAENCKTSLADLYIRNGILEQGAGCTRLSIGQQICCTVNGASSNTDSNAPGSKCTWWATVGSGDTCFSVAGVCKVALPELYRLNTILENGRACNRMIIGQQICCSEVAQTNPIVTTPEPGCTFWWDVNTGDNCFSVAEACRIPITELYSYNKVLENGDGCTRLMVGQHLCCSKSGSPRLSNAPAAVATTAPPPCASPYLVKPGDTCVAAAQICKISLDELYNRNSALEKGNACTRMAIGQRLCCSTS